MEPVYERTNLIITKFDAEDVISTSGRVPSGPSRDENLYGDYNRFDYEPPNAWF